MGKRYASSTLIALPLTVVLLFLMTRLILPTEHDRIVSQMIQGIELRRVRLIPYSEQAQSYELPPAVEIPPPTKVAAEMTDNPIKPPEDAPTENQNAISEDSSRVIDWWAEAQSVASMADDERLKQWLLDNGFSEYVSIMQGPLPVSRGQQGLPALPDAAASSFTNMLGELQIAVSENCVLLMSSQVMDSSDFAQNLPARLICKKPPRKKWSFEREEGRR